MGSKKTKTTQQQSFNTQNAGSTSVPDTPDINAYRGWQPQADPNIPYQAAASHERLHSSLNNPIGGYYSANTRDAIQRSGDRAIDQQASQASRLGQYDVNQQRGGQLSTLAALTRGTNTTGTSSGSGQGTSTTVQSGDVLGQILGAAAQVGLGIATGGASVPFTSAASAGKNRGTGNTAGLPVNSTPWGLIPGSGM